jgi:hypothetical protein
MSTRGLWGFVIDGEEKLTYNHSDSYPDGLGSKLLGWLQEADLDDVRQQARELMMVSDSAPPTPGHRAVAQATAEQRHAPAPRCRTWSPCLSASVRRERQVTRPLVSPQEPRPAHAAAPEAHWALGVGPQPDLQANHACTSTPDSVEFS